MSCKVFEFRGTFLSCPHFRPSLLRGETLASLGFGQAWHPISRIWDRIALQCLLAVLLVIVYLLVLTRDPHAFWCFSPSPDFISLLDIREGDAGAHSQSLEVVECFREIHFFS